MEDLNTNCLICGKEIEKEDSKQILKFYVCFECLDNTNPEDDFLEVKKFLKDLTKSSLKEKSARLKHLNKIK